LPSIHEPWVQSLTPHTKRKLYFIFQKKNKNSIVSSVLVALSKLIALVLLKMARLVDDLMNGLFTNTEFWVLVSV
jgi:hypothetical protein